MNINFCSLSVKKKINSSSFGFVFLVFFVFSFLLYSNLLKSTTEIVFQTPCAVQFILKKPSANTSNSTKSSFFKFVPQLKTYDARDLAKEMSQSALSVEFPLEITFSNGRFTLLCTDSTTGQEIQVTDREYVSTDGVIPPPSGTTYRGAQYGEATRFLNHLFITLAPTYLPYNIIGESIVFGTPKQSSRDLTNYRIGDIPVPTAPILPSLDSSALEPYSFTITFSAPPSGSKTGIYLQQDSEGTTPGNVENWDLNEEDVVSYTFLNCVSGISYRAAISVVGIYDESPLTYFNSKLITGVPPPTDFEAISDLNASDYNALDLNRQFIGPDEYKVLTNFVGRTLPGDLTRRDQIISITIKYYVNIVSSETLIDGPFTLPPTYPSDSRLDIEANPDGAVPSADLSINTNFRVFDYMYWKRVTPSEDSNVTGADVFASTGFPGSNYGGLPLPWADSTITSPSYLDTIFPVDTNGNLKTTNIPNLRFFIGYASNKLLTDGSIYAITKYVISYNPPP